MRLILSVCVAIMLAAPAGAAEQVALQLKWARSYQFAGYYIAREKGYYRDAGLDVEIREGGPDIDIVGEVVSGRAQYATGSAGLLLDRCRGKPVVILGVIFQHSPDVLIVARDSDIITPQQLVGRTIMDSASTPSIKPMLLNEAGSLDKFNFLDQADDKEALMEGRLDALSAYLTDQPYFFHEHGFPIRLFRPLHYGIDFYGDNLFTSEREISAHPERVAAFRGASMRGWEYAMSHPDETIRILQQYGTSRTAEHLRFEYETMRELLLPDLIEIGHMNAGRWKNIADTYVQLGQLNRDYSLEGMLYEEATPPPVERLKRVLGATLAMFLAAGAAILLLWSFNRRLNKQKMIIQEYNVRLQAQLAENMALQAKLREEAIRDPLTGLFNRRYLEETLDRELSRATRERSPLSLAVLDIDHFKLLNDTHGHAAGDVMLRSLAALLRDQTRAEDVVCRYGGEEFVVVLPATSLAHAMQRMGQLRSAVESLSVRHEQLVLQATISIGVAAFPDHGRTSRQLLQAADIALYEAKHGGRNRVTACKAAPPPPGVQQA